jgi:excisionase family DNA binding protein
VPERKYISLDEAAEFLGVSSKTIRRLVSSGDLRAYRAGKRLVRLRSSDVESFLKPIATVAGGDR